MRPSKTNTLNVPAATLYYEVRGAGPVLLLICGGGYDAAGFADLARQLEDRYTVVTYDRRGNSRSHLDGPPESQRIEVHADDARRVLSAVGVTADEPAYVFGNSSGAIIGLELAARHPGQVRVLVAHEPPIFELLADRDYWRTVIQGVAEAFSKEGAGAAVQVLNAGFIAAPPVDGGAQEHGVAAADGGALPENSGTRPEAGGTRPDGGDAADPTQGRIPGGATAPQGEPDPETLAMIGRIEKNMEFFIGYEVPGFARYVPDFEALQAASARLVAAVGATSEDWQPYYRAAVAVADQLGGRPLVFPGDHGGFGADPDAFATSLHEVLADSSTPRP